LTFEEFKKSVHEAPATALVNLSGALMALWHDSRGDWEAAHRAAQEDLSKDGSWVHAYLHRKEGDEGNAGYWYRRAGRPFPDTDLKAEWEQISRSLLTQGHPG